MEVTAEIPTSSHETNAQNRPKPKPRPNKQQYNRAVDVTERPQQSGAQNQPSQNNGRQNPNAQAQLNSQGSRAGLIPTEGTDSDSKKRGSRSRKLYNVSRVEIRREEPQQPIEGDPTIRPTQAIGQSGRRKAKFGARLTDPSSSSTQLSSRSQKRDYRKKPAASEPDDLTSRLIHALKTSPYPDCPICFNTIHPAQRTWSCSPSLPVIRSPDTDSEEQQYCWTTFHVKCIGEWAVKSKKDVAEAWRARGVDGKEGDWRCPGCQAKREILPSGYWCFCGSTPEPKPPRLATPHSCSNPCSRVRESGCGHPCPLECHPGPCPPCQVITHAECCCPRKTSLAFRCGADKGRKHDLSCGNICGRNLGCGIHFCEQVCHEGPCVKCPARELVKCWCGASSMEVACGEGERRFCIDQEDKSWEGRYGCEISCQITFDCGIHQCGQPCHPPHKAQTCPLSPSIITTCPCGTHPIARSLSSSIASTNPTTFPARPSCKSPIPTCDSTCNKPLAGCNHLCSVKCHTGSCPPCNTPITQPCRCGTTTRSVPCSQLLQSSAEILCDKPCMVYRACGRHQCRRPCCPLAHLASTTGKKGKKRIGVAIDVPEVGVGEERGGFHECDLICGKTLSCGLHKCEERDHKGVCPPCLRSSFEEMVCYCGRSVLEPPIPCGTQIRCGYQCPRPPPPCGHPQSQHACHEDPIPCPPCPHLATKQCACGKKMVSNVRCSLETEKVSCGLVCGKLMDCGFHHCQRKCHADACGTCTAICGKLRKLCLPAEHPCTYPCHAPSTCQEDEPCKASIIVTCDCGHLRQSVVCGRNSANPSGRQRVIPKCNDECARAKRNARLADAFGVTPASREKANVVTYSDELMAFARANGKFLSLVEKAFDEFVTTQKKTQVLPHMPPDRRKFVHDLAAVYRMDTELVDQEPHRSVRLLRRLDTRIPSPSLSSFMVSSTPTPTNSGKLTDLRSSGVLSWRVNSTPSLPGGALPGPAAPALATVSGTNNSQRLKTSSANVTRVSSPIRLPSPPAEAPPSPVAVPDSWEDDI